MVRGSRPVALAARLQRSFRLIGAAIGATFAIGAAMAVLLLGVYHPQVEQTTAAMRALREVHQATLEQESALGSYLLTGDEAYRARADEHGAAAAGLRRRVTHLLAGDADLIELVVAAQVAHQRWTTEWATAAARRGGGPDAGDLLDEGDALFSVYRQANDRLVDVVVERRDDALRSEGTVLLVGMLAGGLVSSALLGTVLAQHRLLRRSTVEPVDQLLTEIARIRDGHLGEPVAIDGPTELVQLAEGLTEMSGAVAASQAEAGVHAEKLRLLLGFAREVAGSLNLRYVCESVAAAACRTSGYGRVVVWMIGDEQQLVAAHDGTVPRGMAPTLAPVGLGRGLVGEAAQIGRTAATDDGSELAVPMIVGARVVGVLELTDRRVPAAEASPADLELVETLAMHAAAALEAARLHRHAEEQAVIDPLTRLHNRRRLDADLTAECDRSRRYRRPLAVVMVDADHFKQFNDRHGHQHGDEALQLVASVLADGIRTSDSAYRYGGEEFVLLLREGTADGAVELAERLRTAVRERSRVLAQPVTASFGVAAAPEDGVSPAELIAAADRALYDAKHGGRNRVARAGAAEDAGRSVLAI